MCVHDFQVKGNKVPTFLVKIFLNIFSSKVVFTFDEQLYILHDYVNRICVAPR